MSLNGTKCNILLCDTKVHVCWLCSVIHCVVLSVPLGMSLGWDVDFQSNTMISYFYLTPSPPPTLFLGFANLLFSSPVRKYRKSYCSHPGVGVGVSVGVGVAQNVKIFG